VELTGRQQQTSKESFDGTAAVQGGAKREIERLSGAQGIPPQTTDKETNKGVILYNI
jgi:hypothetical protein